MYTTYASSSGVNYLEYNANFNVPTAAANTFYRERRIVLGLRAHF